MAPAFADLRTPQSLANVEEMPAFYDRVANGTLPQYTLIQPRMATSATGPSNWQHPDGSVSAGENLLAVVRRKGRPLRAAVARFGWQATRGRRGEEWRARG